MLCLQAAKLFVWGSRLPTERELTGNVGGFVFFCSICNFSSSSVAQSDLLQCLLTERPPAQTWRQGQVTAFWFLHSSYWGNRRAGWLA